jgi:hypothetical protein
MKMANHFMTKTNDACDLERLLKAAYRTMTEEEVAWFWRFVQWVVCSIASTIYWGGMVTVTD